MEFFKVDIASDDNIGCAGYNDFPEGGDGYMNMYYE